MHIHLTDLVFISISHAHFYYLYYATRW